VTLAIARRELDQAQAIATGIESHGLRVDGNDRPKIEIARQVLLMQVDRHWLVDQSSTAPRASGPRYRRDL
jgi:hypothetical protein